LQIGLLKKLLCILLPKKKNLTLEKKVKVFRFFQNGSSERKAPEEFKISKGSQSRMLRSICGSKFALFRAIKEILRKQ